MDPFTVAFGLQMARTRDAQLDREMERQRRWLLRRETTVSPDTSRFVPPRSQAMRMPQAGGSPAHATP